jgi:hypothetical protein
MGAWAAHSFGNEEALDWLNDLFDERDIYFIHNTLEIIAEFPPEDKPEAWDCCCAIAASEMVAAASGKPSSEFPQAAKEWLDAYGFQADDEALELARKAVDRVQTNSRLKEHWEKSSRSAEWYHCLSDLRTRLG